LIDDAQRAHRVSGLRHEGGPGVEADPWIADHKRVIAKTLVIGRIRNDRGVSRIENGIAAERHRARRLRHIQADTRLEPLSVAIDQRDQSDRRIADMCRQSCCVVVCLLRQRVQDAVRVELCEALGLILWQPGGNGAVRHVVTHHEI
jgi:hypothetical protein